MSTDGNKEWDVPMSKSAERTFNPLRTLPERLKLAPSPEKSVILLSAGDPTVFGNLPTSDVCEKAVQEVLFGRKYNGYYDSAGITEARQAVAEYASTPTSKVEAQDVILTSGCSGSLELSITGLASPGQTLLLPRPSFHLYNVIAVANQINVKYYDLVPEKSWEIDLDQLESLVDNTTAAILVCNPSNPCGSVFSEEHMRDILKTVSRLKVPLIADEIYEHFVFSGSRYHSFASLSKDVPILTCSGLTKRFLVPGWRMGWVIINDRNGVFTEVRKGLHRLSQMNRGPCALIQGALPTILKNTPESFFSDTLKCVEKNAEDFYKRLSQIPGLKPIKPQGSMFMVVGIDFKNFPEFESDYEFTKEMFSEESVFCFPASCFEYPNYFRVVLTAPPEKVTEACHRIQQFCQRHYRPTSAINGNR